MLKPFDFSQPAKKMTPADRYALHKQQWLRKVSPTNDAYLDQQAMFTALEELTTWNRAIAVIEARELMQTMFSTDGKSVDLAQVSYNFLHILTCNAFFEEFLENKPDCLLVCTVLMLKAIDVDKNYSTFSAEATAMVRSMTHQKIKLTPDEKQSCAEKLATLLFDPGWLMVYGETLGNSEDLLRAITYCPPILLHPQGIDEPELNIPRLDGAGQLPDIGV